MTFTGAPPVPNFQTLLHRVFKENLQKEAKCLDKIIFTQSMEKRHKKISKRKRCIKARRASPERLQQI